MCQEPVRTGYQLWRQCARDRSLRRLHMIRSAPMRIEYIDAAKWEKRGGNHHLLTYAELGGTPLDCHGRSAGIDSVELGRFTYAVNMRGAVLTLFPKAYISALPRKVMEARAPKEELARFLAAFLELNRSRICATELALDFRGPGSPPNLEPALQAAIADVGDDTLSLVCIVQ